MSNQTKHSLSPIIFDGFSGEDRARSHQNAPLSGELVNFRILPDGSLEKRCGYRFLTELAEKPRAFWSGVIDGVYTGYAICKNRLEEINLLDGTKKLLATLGTEEGNACLFFWDQVLYLMDTSGVYRYDEEGFHTATGYIPLVGKDWPNDYMGKPYEPINLLSRRVRVSYRISPDVPSIFLFPPEPIESIDAVFLNGTRLPEDAYYFYEDYGTINVPGLQGNDQVLVYLTLKGNAIEGLRDISTYNRTFLYESSTSPRLFFWNDREIAPMVCSSYVENAQMQELVEQGAPNDSLYIPKGYAFTVGDGNVKIQGMVRQQDHLLIFTERSVWKADASVSGLSEIPAVNVTTNLGCSAPLGIVSPENDPIVLCHHTVRRWSAHTSRSDLYQTSPISREIDSIFTPDDYRNAILFYHQAKDELWLTQPSTGDVWIYSMTAKHWVRFGEIFADRLFDVGGSVGFLQENVLYVFDEVLKKDRIREDTTREIRAEFETNLLDFGSDGKKNLSHVILKGDLDAGSITVTISGDSLPSVSRVVSGEKDEEHSILRLRLSTGRFQKAKLRLCAKGTARQKIHSLELYPR